MDCIWYARVIMSNEISEAEVQNSIKMNNLFANIDNLPARPIRIRKIVEISLMESSLMGK